MEANCPGGGHGASPVLSADVSAVGATAVLVCAHEPDRGPAVGGQQLSSSAAHRDGHSDSPAGRAATPAPDGADSAGQGQHDASTTGCQALAAGNSQATRSRQRTEIASRSTNFTTVLPHGPGSPEILAHAGRCVADPASRPAMACSAAVLAKPCDDPCCKRPPLLAEATAIPRAARGGSDAAARLASSACAPAVSTTACSCAINRASRSTLFGPAATRSSGKRCSRHPALVSPNKSNKTWGHCCGHDRAISTGLSICA